MILIFSRIRSKQRWVCKIQCKRSIHKTLLKLFFSHTVRYFEFGHNVLWSINVIGKVVLLVLVTGIKLIKDNILNLNCRLDSLKKKKNHKI